MISGRRRGAFLTDQGLSRSDLQIQAKLIPFLGFKVFAEKVAKEQISERFCRLAIEKSTV